MFSWLNDRVKPCEANLQPLLYIETTKTTIVLDHICGPIVCWMDLQYKTKSWQLQNPDFGWFLVGWTFFSTDLTGIRASTKNSRVSSWNAILDWDFTTTWPEMVAWRENSCTHDPINCFAIWGRAQFLYIPNLSDTPLQFLIDDDLPRSPIIWTDQQWSEGDICMTFDICLSIQKSLRDHHLLRPEPALVRPPKRLLMNWDLCPRRNERCSPRSSDTTKVWSSQTRKSITSGKLI